MEPKTADLVAAIECRVGNVESELVGMQRAAELRARDNYNQAIGFACGVAWTVALFYLIRR